MKLFSALPRCFLLTSLALLCSLSLRAETVAKTNTMAPKVGELSPNFTLSTAEGKKVELSQLTARKKVVLLVLRGYPGTQCIDSTNQVLTYIRNEPALTARGAQVLMVYPGPAEVIKDRALRFLDSKPWTNKFTMVLDPDYKFTIAYGLRWNEPRETAYPATFLIDTSGVIRFAHIGKTHIDRPSIETVLAELGKM